MARSLAFWLENIDPDVDNPTEVELHFNYWSLNNININYLDIGVRLKKQQQTKSINFYLPFDRNAINYISELSQKICTTDDLIPAVFNCPFEKKTPILTDGYCDVDFSNHKDGKIRFLTNLKLSTPQSKTGVKITTETPESGKEGCIITFGNELFKSVSERDDYFRFRIELTQKGLKSIQTKDKPTFSAVTNNHEVSETIDFRVNEVRNLPDNVRKHINKVKCIKKIHFFLIRESRAEYKLSHTNYKRCRILENDLWENYLNIEASSKKKSIKEQMLIYHWATNNDETIDHFSAFAKFSSKPVRLWQILAVLLVALLTGFFASTFTNYFWKNFEEPVACTDNEIDVTSSKVDFEENENTFENEKITNTNLKNQKLNKEG